MYLTGGIKPGVNSLALRFVVHGSDKGHGVPLQIGILFDRVNSPKKACKQFTDRQANELDQGLIPRHGLLSCAMAHGQQD